MFPSAVAPNLEKRSTTNAADENTIRVAPTIVVARYHSPLPPGYNRGVDVKQKRTELRLHAIAMLAVAAAIAGGPFIPEIALGASAILGIVGCLNWINDPP